MTENTREVQLKIGADATGVRTGVEQAKTAIQDLGRTAEREGAKAGAGLGKAGDGAEKAAQKIERETRSMIGSIERATAAFKAGERGTSNYFEALAKQRGVSGDAIKPYIEQLRQAEAAQKAAQGSLNGIGVSAAQTTAALRQVPAQFGDIITSLQGGQAPLTVLLQQGGQLKDAFGGLGSAARALGGYVLGLVNPFTVAAAAAAGLFLAYQSGAEESRAFARTLILTGNATGATVNKLVEAAAGLKSFEITQAAAAEAINQLAATGKVGADSLGRFAAVAVQLGKVGGPAVEETVKAFSELGKAPLQASLKLNESTNFLTASLYHQISALEQQGRATEAAKLAQDAFAAAAESRIPRLAGDVGLLERAWKGVKSVIAGIGDDLANVGRADTVSGLERQLRNAEIKARDAGPAGLLAILAQRDLDSLKQRIAAAKEVERLAQRTAEAEAARARQVGALAEFEKIADQSLTNRQKLAQEIQRIEALGLLAGKSRADIEAQITAARERFKDDATAELASQRAKLKEADAYLAKLKEIRATGNFSALDDAKQTEAQKRVIELQEQLKTSIGGVTRAKLGQELAGAQQLAAIQDETRQTEASIKFLRQAQDEYQKLIAQNYASAKSTETQAKQQEELNQQLGKGATAAAMYRLQALEAERAVFLQAELVDAAQLASIQAKIDAQKRFVDSLKAADLKTLNVGLDEWLRSATERERVFRDEQALAGLTAVERAKIVASREIELKLAKELAEIDRASVSDEAKDQLRAKARAAAARESSAAVNKVLREDADKTSADIERTLTDALMRGFESGKGFAANLRDTVTSMFKTMVLRPVIKAVLQPVTNSLTSWVQGLMGAGGGGVGLGQLISGAGSLFNMPWLSSLAGGMGAAGAAGTGAAGAASGAAAGSSGLLGSASAAGPLAAMIAMFMGAADSAYANGFNQNNLPYTRAWLQTGGLAPPTVKFDTNALVKLGVNERLANVITGASLWSRAFGRSAPQVQGQGISGTANMGGFTGQAFADWIQKGGWFRSDKTGTDRSPISSSLDAELDRTVGSVYKATAAYAKVLGLPVEAVSDYSAAFKVVWGKTEEENKAALEAAVADLGEDLAKRYAAQLQPMQRYGETLAATLQRLSTLKTFSDGLSNLGGVFARVASGSVEAREHLIELAGGMDALSEQALGFAQNYYSREEVAGLKARELQSALGDAGVSTEVNTREQFRALVESIDPGSATGREQLAALLQLQGSFATVADYLAETGLTLGQAAAQAPAIDSLVSPLLSNSGQQLQLTQQSVDVQYETRDATLQVVRAVEQLTSLIASSSSTSGAGWAPGSGLREVQLAP